MMRQRWKFGDFRKHNLGSKCRLHLASLYLKSNLKSSESQPYGLSCSTMARKFKSLESETHINIHLMMWWVWVKRFEKDLLYAMTNCHWQWRQSCSPLRMIIMMMISLLQIQCYTISALQCLAGCTLDSPPTAGSKEVTDRSSRSNCQRAAMQCNACIHMCLVHTCRSHGHHDDDNHVGAIQ